MGIHYDYKSTRGDKAMKKEAKRKARIEQRRAKRSSNSSISLESVQTHNWKSSCFNSLIALRVFE